MVRRPCRCPYTVLFRLRDMQECRSSCSCCTAKRELSILDFVPFILILVFFFFKSLSFILLSGVTTGFNAGYVLMQRFSAVTVSPTALSLHGVEALRSR